MLVEERENSVLKKLMAMADVLWIRVRAPLGVVCLYFLLAMSLMGPIASDEIVAGAPDHANHAALIVQARMAMDEGQFPLRITPWQYDRQRYPEFQFYSPLPYEVGGLIYKYIVPNNPYSAYKITMLLFITLGGVYMCRTARYLTGSMSASLLAGAAYVVSPYLIINVLMRGTLTEVVAQGIMPASLYYSLRCVFSRRWRSVLWATLWLVFLAASHFITFVFATVFLGVLLGAIGILRIRRFVRLPRLALAYLLACVMLAYWLAPVLLISKFMNVVDHLLDPMDWTFLTPLSSLLGPASAMSEPQPGRSSTVDLNPAVGWPILAAVCSLVSLMVFQRKGIPKSRGGFLIIPLLCMFVLALFAIWSPVDFWKHLPKVFGVVQFSYRLLTFVMWSGALLLAFALCALFGRSLDIRYVAVGLVLLGWASSSYIHTLARAQLTPEDIKARPDVGYARTAYLVKASQMFPMPFGCVGQLPTQGGWLAAEQELPIFCPDQFAVVLRIQGRLPEDVFKGPITLATLVDGVPVGSNRVNPGPFDLAITVPIPASDRQAGKPFRLSFRSDNPVVLRDGQGRVVKQFALFCQSIAFDNREMIPAAALEGGRVQKGTVTSCKASLDRDAIVQLPVMYYPRMLEVLVDGKKTESFPTTSTVSGEIVLAGVNLPAGTHEICVEFRGMPWANYLSVAGWILFLLMALGGGILRWRKRPERNLLLWAHRGAGE